MGINSLIRRKEMREEIEETLKTEGKPIESKGYQYCITVDNNGKRVMYFDEAFEIGCASAYEETEKGTVYQVFWQCIAEDDMGFYYGVTKPLDVDIDDIHSWLTLGRSLASQYYFSKGVLNHLIEEKEKCSEIIDMAKRMKAEVLSQDYRTQSSYRDSDPWASIDDAISIAEEETKKGKSK